MLLAKLLLLHYRKEEFAMLNALRYYLSGLAFGLLVAVNPSVSTAAQTVLSERQISLALAGEAAEAAQTMRAVSTEAELVDADQHAEPDEDPRAVGADCGSGAQRSSSPRVSAN
jgi:hypothetical protein